MIENLFKAVLMLVALLVLPGLAWSRMYKSPPVVEVIRSRTSISALAVMAGAGRLT